MFPRFLFDKPDDVATNEHGAVVDDMAKPADEEFGKKGLAPTHTAASERVGDVLPGYEKRTAMQTDCVIIKLIMLAWHYHAALCI